MSEKPKFLFVGNDKVLLEEFKDAFNDYNVVIAYCKTIKGALEAIWELKPEVLFLDHHLTKYGDEGIEIADAVKGIKIFSTTDDRDVWSKYQMRGIQFISIADIKGIEKILAGK